MLGEMREMLIKIKSGLFYIELYTIQITSKQLCSS